MDECRIPVETTAGIISGRDAIYLDDINFSYCPTTVEFVGQLNASLCNNVDTDADFIPYRLRFTGVLVFRMIELDFDSPGLEYQSSFDVIENSSFVQSLRNADHSAKVKADHRHYVLATYDDVFEIVSTGSSFDLCATTNR